MTRMKKRKLGNSDLEVSALGLGCMGLSFGYGPATDNGEAISLIRAPVEGVISFLDTAEVLGPFRNRHLVGEARAPYTERVVVPTNVGFEPDGPRGSRSQSVDGRPERIRQVAAASLKRLEVDVVDRFYQHRVDTAVPIE